MIPIKRIPIRRYVQDILEPRIDAMICLHGKATVIRWLVEQYSKEDLYAVQVYLKKKGLWEKLKVRMR